MWQNPVARSHKLSNSHGWSRAAVRSSTTERITRKHTVRLIKTNPFKESLTFGGCQTTNWRLYQGLLWPLVTADPPRINHHLRQNCSSRGLRPRLHAYAIATLPMNSSRVEIRRTSIPQQIVRSGSPSMIFQSRVML